MKQYKIIVAICCVAALLCTFNSCGLDFDSDPFTYSFRQDRNNISKIEICTYAHENDGDGGVRESLAELPADKIDALLADIQSLKCRKFIYLDPILSYGDVIIAITYLDGETEIIGIHNIGWISSDGIMTTTPYRFDNEDICAVIAKYADAEILAGASEHFR